MKNINSPWHQKLLLTLILIVSFESYLVQSISQTCFSYSMPVSFKFDEISKLIAIDHKNDYVYAVGLTYDQSVTNTTFLPTTFYTKTHQSGKPSYIMAIENQIFFIPTQIKVSLTSVFIYFYHDTSPSLNYISVFNENDGQLTDMFQIFDILSYSYLSLTKQSMDVNQNDEAFITITPTLFGPDQTKFLIIKIFKGTTGYEAQVLLQTAYTSGQNTRCLFTKVIGDYVYAAGELNIIGSTAIREAAVIKMNRFGVVQAQGVSYNVQTISNVDIHYLVMLNPPNSNYVRVLVIKVGINYMLQTFNFGSGITVNKKLAYYTNKSIQSTVFTGTTANDKLYIAGYETQNFAFSSTNQLNMFTYEQGFIQVQQANGDRDQFNDCTADFTTNNTMTTYMQTSMTNVVSENIYSYIGSYFQADANSYEVIDSGFYASLEILDSLKFINSISDNLAINPTPNNLYIQSQSTGQNLLVNVTASNSNIGLYYYIYKAKLLPINQIVEFPFMINITQSLTNPCLYPENITDVMNNQMLIINYTLGQSLSFALIDWYYLGGSNVTCQYFTSLSSIPSAITSYLSYDASNHLSFETDNFSLVWRDNGLQNFSDFIQISEDQQYIQMQSSLATDEGQYYIEVSGTLKYYNIPMYYWFDLIAKVQCTITPSAIQSPQNYLVGASKTIIYIPFQSQYCKEPIKYVSQLDNGNALPSFINFREGNYIIETNNNTKIESSYNVKLIGSVQSENVQAETKFTIKIQFPDVLKRFNITTNQSQNSNATKTPVVSDDYYSMSTKITSISQNGVVSVSFDPEFKLLSNDPQTNKQYFSFEVSVPNSDDKMDKSQYNFNILEISKQKMSVQLEFNDPSTISMKVAVEIKLDLHLKVQQWEICVSICLCQQHYSTCGE
eukprot:403353333